MINAEANCDEEGDDELVAEFPIYLSTDLAKQLYILKYSDRLSGQLPYEEASQSIRRVRMKPKQELIEIDLGIDSSTENYDDAMGRQIMVNSRGGKIEKDETVNTHFDKIVLKSRPGGKPGTKYAVGVYNDGAFHLTPVKKLLQLRPDLSYLEGGDFDDDKKKNADEDNEEEAKPVMVKFARPESERTKRFHERSYTLQNAKRANEPWINMNYHPTTSQLSKKSLDRLICKNKNEVPAAVVTVPNEAFQSSANLVHDLKKNQYLSSELSLLEIQSLPLRDQIDIIFINGKIFTFNQLLGLLANDGGPLTVARAVQQVALLVQGCWVVKSELLYPKDAASVHSGVSAELLCRGRDYIMWKFTQSRFLRRSDVCSITKLPQEDIQEFLDGMARSSTNKYWEFLLPTDNQFMEKFPDVVDRQEKIWEMKSKHLEKGFNLSKNSVETKYKTNMSDAEGGEGLKSPKSRSRKQSSSSSKRRSSESASESEKPKVDYKIEKLSQSPPGKPVGIKNELSSFVAEVLNSSYVLTLSALRQHLDAKMAESDPGHVLGQGITDKLLEEAVLSVGGEHINKSWVKVSWTEPIYALMSNGDHLDVWRRELVGFFGKNVKARKATAKKKMEVNLSMVIEDADFNKLLKDYCVAHKNGMYVLKGTANPQV